MGDTREILDMKKPIKGMATDTSPLNQVPNSYRMAMNMSMESREGDYSSLVNEEGNQECFQLEEGEKIIGTILINNGDTIIFIAHETQNYSKISLMDKGCILTNLVKSSCLNFNKAYPIHGTFKINNGCDRIIYFTDNFNPIRSINLDNLGQYTDKIGTTPTDWINDANTNDTWKCEIFKNSPDIDIPTIELISEKLGAGALKVGAYTFAIRYLDESTTPTNWMYITELANVGFPIIGNAIDHYTNYDGGTLTNPDLEIATALELEITNLDTNFPYYQLAVIQYTDGLETVTDSYTLPFISFTSSTHTYLFTGREITSPVDVDEITVPSITFNKVGSIAQTDNRLMLANLNTDIRDWSEFQKEASKIKVDWEISAAKKFDPEISLAPELEDASTGICSFQLKTFQRDEIYALGIVYVFKDGSESPVFHIPGRAKNVGYNRFFGDFTNTDLVTIGNANVHRRNQVPALENWDTQLITVVADGALADFDTEIEEKNVVHIPLTEFVGSPASYIGEEIERWKLYNTAVIKDVFGNGTAFRQGFEGVMAYYESDELYPDIKDCLGQSIWGDDAWGTPLADTPIRHHKIPDTTLVISDFGKVKHLDPHTSLIYPIHLRYNDINIPAAYASDIQGVYAVMANREEVNYTVLDTGILGGTNYSAGYNRSYPTMTDSPTKAFNNENEVDETCVLVTPRCNFLKNLRPSGYLKFEDLLDSDHEVISIFKDNRTLLPTSDIYRKVDSYAYVDRNLAQAAIGTFPNPLLNDLGDLDVLFVHLNKPKVTLASSFVAVAEAFLTDVEHIYVSVKQWLKPYNNLFELSYVRTHTGLYEELGGTVLKGDCFIGEMTFRASFRRACGGVYFYNEELLENVSEGKLFQNFYFSTTLNTELRQRGEESYEHHWRAFKGDAIDFINTCFPGGDGVPDPSTANPNPNYFNLNRDMSLVNDLRIYYPLPRGYDFCSECTEDFPTRIWYSQRAYQEVSYDNYRVFLANEYRDLLSNGGEITHLFVFKDQLYAQTPEATWFVSTRPQELQTNEGTISVGTGDLLAIPPKRLETVERGYAGNQDKFSSVVSEFGVTWVDANAGKVFNFSQGLEELSAQGMRNWFAENLVLSGGINDQIPELDIKSTVHRNGIGFISTFDPRHNRYILRKKYYKIIDEDFLASLYVDNQYLLGTTLGFNTETGEFYEWPIGPEYTIINIVDNTEIVEDLGWTISYSYPHKSWVSYHSYKANWMWHDRNNMFSYSNDTYDDANRYSWKHNSRNYGQFYNRVHPSSLYLIFNAAPIYPKTFNDIEIISTSYNWVGNQLVEREDDSFNEAFLHTGRQSSGILEIDVKNTLDNSNPFVSLDSSLSTIKIQNNEGVWNYSKFQDLTIDHTLPIFTNDWSNVLYQNKRSIDGYVFYPNDQRDLFSKSLFQASPLRDKWIGCFMNYYNTDSYKFVVDYLATIENISFK